MYRLWAVLVCVFVGWACCLGDEAEEDKAKKKAEGKAAETLSTESGKSAESGEGVKAEPMAGAKSGKVEEVIVTATRTPQPARQVGKWVTAITSKEVREKGYTNMTELFRGLPGVSIVNQGGVGGMRRIQIRGANSEHTLLLINGIPITDPTSVDADINSFLGDMSTEDVERIEILRGSQSTLYGSDAIGGVVNIILKEGRKPRIRATWEGGSQSTSRETWNLSSGIIDLPLLDYATINFHGYRIDSNGIPSLNDNYEDTLASLNSRVYVVPELSFGIIYRSLRAHQHYDDYDSWNIWPPGPVYDDNQWRSLDQDFYAFDMTHELGDVLDSRLFYSETRTQRQHRDDLNPAEDLGYYYFWQGTFVGRTSNFNAQMNIHPFGDLLTVSLGYEFERQIMRSNTTEWTSDWMQWPPATFWAYHPTDARMSNKAYYMEAQVRLWDRIFVTGGVRKDHHSDWYGHDTGEVSAAIIVPYTETKLKANWGLGFKTPSLYQLHDPIVGNPSLQPENSESWDIGFEQPLFGDVANVGLSYFQTDFYNLIGWANTNDPSRLYGGEFRNLGNAESEGIEFAARFKPWKPVTVKTYYTYTHTRVGTGSPNRGKRLLNVPRDVVGVDINWIPIERMNVNFDLSYTGPSVWRYQSEVPAGSPWGGASPGPHTGGLNNPGFWLGNLTVRYQLTENVTVWGRCENIFDQKYYNFGVPAARISAYGGLGIRF